MGLYEDYKRFKAGKPLTSISRYKLKLFNLDFTEEQIMAFSEYEFKTVVIATILIVASFIMGSMWGAA